MKVFIFDLDGTVFKWQSEGDYLSPHYFRHLPADKLIVDVIKKLQADGEYIVFGTATLNDIAAFDKREALNELGFSNIPMFAVQNGSTKTSILSKSKEIKRILIDDYSQNLKSFEGIGVKYCNGINDTNKSWKGCRISNNMSAQEICDILKNI